MKAELVPENGDPPIPITKDVTVIGRREFCDVQINHPSLSKRHAVVVMTDGLLVIRDLATTNGTKVKGQRIRWAALLPDDRVTLGAYKVRIYLGSDEQLAPSERAGRVTSKARPLAAAMTPLASPVPIASGSESGFASPSPVTGIPVFNPSPDADLEVLQDESDGSESEWRHLIASKPRAVKPGDDDDDLIIELD